VQGGVTPGVPNDVVFGNWLDFGPRLGLAYRIASKWVIRTGAGIYYDSRTGQIAQQTFSNPPTFANVTVNCALAGQSCNLKQPDNWTFVDPGYSATKIPFPTKPTDQIQLAAIQPHGKTDRVIQDNFAIQHELPANLLLETGYVGTKGTHLWRLAICSTSLIPDRQRFRWTFAKDSCSVSMKTCWEQVPCDAGHNR
jgi:hypothetical protein